MSESESDMSSICTGSLYIHTLHTGTRSNTNLQFSLHITSEIHQLGLELLRDWPMTKFVFMLQTINMTKLNIELHIEMLVSLKATVYNGHNLPNFGAHFNKKSKHETQTRNTNGY